MGTSHIGDGPPWHSPVPSRDMTETIEIKPGVTGALAGPAGEGQAPGLLVIHEWHGVTDGIRALCTRFAGEGFLALAPDLYHGQVATDDETAAGLMNALSTESAMDDLRAAVATLAAHPRCNGKVGIVGFCMGGAMAVAAAGAVEGLVCAVPFYGLPRPDFFDPSKVKCPIQAHFAANDGWAVPDKAAAFRDGVNAHGGAMELHVYDAGHAFMREGDARVYDAASAASAWTRTTAYLHRHLG